MKAKTATPTFDGNCGPVGPSSKTKDKRQYMKVIFCKRPGGGSDDDEQYEWQ